MIGCIYQQSSTMNEALLSLTEKQRLCASAKESLQIVTFASISSNNMRTVLEGMEVHCFDVAACRGLQLEETVRSENQMEASRCLVNIEAFAKPISNL